MQARETPWAHLENFFALGARTPQSSGHAAADALVWRHLGRADWRRRLRFTTATSGHKPIVAHNLWGRLLGRRPGRVMLATRYDWPIVDGENATSDVGVRHVGPAGPACLTALVDLLAQDRERPTVDLVFIDGQADALEPNAGARAFLRELTPFERPDCVTFVGAVGGPQSMLDLDLNLSAHEPSRAHALALFQLAYSLKLSAFKLEKHTPYRDSAGAHTAFGEEGLATTLLTDTDQAPANHRDPLEAQFEPSTLLQITTLIRTSIFHMTVV